MSRALIRLVLGSAAPPVLLPRRDLTLVAPFGRWLRDEFATLQRGCPAVEFQRLRLRAGEVVLVVEFSVAAPPLGSALALMRRLRCDTEAAARRRGWLREGDRLWGAQQLVVVVPPTFRSGPVSGAPAPAGGRVRSSTRQPVRGR